MAFTPISEIHFCNTKIDNSLQNQLLWTNQEAQLNYFRSVTVRTESDYTFIKPQNIIRVNGNIEEWYNCNYVMYQNRNFTGVVWHFAFITDLRWRSDESTDIVIEEDWFQTFYWQAQIKECFVEREHGDVTQSISVAEGLDYGNEYVLRQQVHLWDTAGANYVVCMTETVMDIMKSKWWDKIPPAPMGRAPQAVHYYQFDNNFRNILAMPATTEEKQILDNPLTYTNPVEGDDNWASDLGKVSQVLNSLLVAFNPAAATGAGWFTALSKYNEVKETVTERASRFANAIIEIFRLPFDGTESYYDDEYHCHRLYGGIPELNSGSAASGITASEFADPKLNTFPYSYFKLTNHKGSEQIYKPEYVASPHISYVSGFGSPVTVRYWCDNYQGYGVQKDMSVISNTNNTVPVLNDRYGSYLMNSKTQNDVAVANSIIGGVASAGIGFAVGGPVGAAVGGIAGTAVNVFQQISSQNAKKQDIRDQPPTVTGGANNGNFELNDESDGVWVELWTINDQHGRILTDYFKRYGYAYNITKVPNFVGTSRTYCFCKTSDSNVTGNIPTDALVTIKQMLNQGCTFWTDPNKVGEFD